MRYYEIMTEDDEPDHSHLPSVAIVKHAAPQICVEAQKVYDVWQQDESGYDEEWGYGGICQNIAERAIASVLTDAGVDCRITSANDEVHVYCVAVFREGVYTIDIHHSWYERGAAYTWKKLPDVKFTPDMVSTLKLDGNPANFENYTDDD